MMTKMRHIAELTVSTLRLSILPFASCASPFDLSLRHHGFIISRDIKLCSEKFISKPAAKEIKKKKRFNGARIGGEAVKNAPRIQALLTSELKAGQLSDASAQIHIDENLM
jgi:hypothetical protein